MSQKRITILFLIMLFLFSPLIKTYAQNSNVGFVSGNIWYSEDPFKEGDKITIHTIIYNSDSRELSGTVFFFDKTLFLGNRSLSVAPKSSADISINWTVTPGSHAIFAQIQNAKFLLSNGKYETAILNDAKSDESIRTVEKTIIPTTNSADKNSDTNINGLSNISISETIKNSTPEIVSTSIDKTATALEGIRENISSITDKNKLNVKKSIDSLNGETINSDKKIATKTESTKNLKKNEVVKEKTTNNNPILKPFLYVKLFFLSLFSFIFGSKLAFYGILIFLIFLLLRFLWRLIF